MIYVNYFIIISNILEFLNLYKDKLCWYFLLLVIYVVCFFYWFFIDFLIDDYGKKDIYFLRW